MSATQRIFQLALRPLIILILLPSTPTFAQRQDAIPAGDVAWMLTSAALVLFMTAPGLALFYSGLVRRKNVLSIMMQCLFLMGLMTVAWALWGYSLSFGGDGRWIGNSDHLFLRGLTMVGGELPGDGLPELAFMVFQGMFFVITPALICGAFAERMRFSAMTAFMLLWGTLVYCPLCHWVWDGGLLSPDNPNALMGGALDFAGGTVVHISSGIAALVCAMLVGRRLGHRADDMRPHNLTYTAVGAAMLWVGWFGFNAGSAGAANDLAVNAFVTTHLAAAAGALAWAGIEWFTRSRPSLLGTASGAVAGLVCITPACGYVQPMPALVMGAMAGAACYLGCGVLKSKIGYDDSLDAFGIHGIGGTLGGILTGVFACQEVNPSYPNGLYYSGQFDLLIGQIAAVSVTILFSAVVSFILLKILDATIGLRVTQDGELEGLDVSEHGEEGYIFN